MLIETLIAFTLLINAERLHPLQPDIFLTIRAEERAEYICADLSNRWSHANWLESFEGLNRGMVGENLARDFLSRETAHQALMNSPTHRANIESPYYTRVGVAEGSCGVYVFLFSN